MAKNKKEEQADGSPTVKNIQAFLDAWKQEKRTGKKMLDERTLVALRLKLSGLYRQGIIHELEQELLLAVLQRDRTRGQLSHIYEADLAKMEAEQCTDHCEVKHPHIEPVLRWPKGMQGVYRIDEQGRYHVYTQHVTPGTHQWSLSLARKVEQGRPVDDSEYPQDKTYWRHKSIRPEEFHAWFDIIDSGILDAPTFVPDQSAPRLQIEL